MSDYSAYHSSGNLSNAHGHGAKSSNDRTSDTQDMAAGVAAQFSPLPPSGVRVKTGENKPGRDTSDSRQGLCHSDKSFGCCCTSGI